MRVVLQRVGSASVSVEGERAGAIGRGFLLLVGVGKGDPEDEPARLAEKIANLRLFADDEGWDEMKHWHVFHAIARR